MKLNNIWGYGQLFAFSGLDGVTRHQNDFVGTLTEKKGEIRFELQEWISVYFPVKGKLEFRAITGDMIDAENKRGELLILFASEDGVVGYAPNPPVITAEKKLRKMTTWGIDVYATAYDHIAVITEKCERGYRFAIRHSSFMTGARAGVKELFRTADPDKIKKDRYAYFEKMPPCKSETYEQLYYKALSVNKVNVHSPQGTIPCRWTTPNRVPHRHMWLWDSVFHALAMLPYNPPMAKDCLRSVLSQAHSDGFIPHLMTPFDQSDMTQPQVLAWGVWEIYQKTGDRAFLEECAPRLEGYLTWDNNNRDKNGNGLLEWLTEPDRLDCKCGESGLDNSPRFDFDAEADAIDFSTFAARDAAYLAKIFRALADEQKAEKWEKISVEKKAAIDRLMWDEETGAYYDLLFTGEPTRILTPVSFLPLLAGIPSKERAARMVKLLTDESKLWTPLPLSSVAKDHPTYSNDMWRGGVWLNLNYFIMRGLSNYGYTDLAATLRKKTLDAVLKWYKKTGAIFEFYDPEDKTVPYRCNRKGRQPRNPDWRKHLHSIVDFNWSACFALLMIEEESASAR